jgi:hypothetical protein
MLRRLRWQLDAALDERESQRLAGKNAEAPFRLPPPLSESGAHLGSTDRLGIGDKRNRGR